MPILQDIPVTLTPRQIIAAPPEQEIRPGLLRDAERALDVGATLWVPVAVYDLFDVLAIDGQDVQLAPTGSSGQDVRLHVGPKVDLLQPARKVLVSVGTIGPALEQRVQELNAGREALRAYMLDSAGVVALGSVGEAVRCLAEEKAEELGWGVSASLSPGSLVGWPLWGQKQLCDLLDLDAIGVRLNNHGVLEPHKSASGLIGMGPGYESTRVGSVCKYCALQKTCWRRRRDAA
jgi:hypothetical protein